MKKSVKDYPHRKIIQKKATQKIKSTNEKSTKDKVLMINVQIKIHTKDKVNTKEKNYRRISKNISQKSKEKLTKDFIKIPKEKTYNANSWYFYQLFCVYYCNIKIFL